MRVVKTKVRTHAVNVFFPKKINYSEHLLCARPYAR